MTLLASMNLDFAWGEGAAPPEVGELRRFKMSVQRSVDVRQSISRSVLVRQEVIPSIAVKISVE